MSPCVNAFTVDVEEHFQVAALVDGIERDSWDSQESRVCRNTERLLELLNDRDVRGTFFVLGWVAERHPDLVRTIVSQGHELACHGFGHQQIFRQSPDTFRQETLRAKGVLEDVGGCPVRGYRAASYSITAESIWALDILIDAGFEYDSSIVPVRHDLYGIVGMPADPHRLVTPTGRSIVEFPPSTIEISNFRISVAGGGYFRLYPYWFTRWCLSRINHNNESPFSFYVHPWEIDVDQPRVEVGWKSRFRHYNNLDKCETRLGRLLNDFRFESMEAVLSSLELEEFVLSGLLD